MTGLSALRTIGWTEWRLLAASVPLLIAVRIGLWLLPSATIVRRVRELAARPRTVPEPTVPACDVAWAVEAAARRIPGATCLTQAVSAQLLLLRHGHQAELCVGVARDEAGSFRAHAWVETDGKITVGGRGARGFSRLTDFVVPGQRSQAVSSAGPEGR